MAPKFINRFLAEVFGTFVLVFSVIGAALFATRLDDSGMLYAGAGVVGVALALGLGVLIAAYTVGGISGGHFNPAVTLGLAVAGKFAWKDVVGYIVAQIIGGIIGASVLFAIASNSPYLTALRDGGFASNGFNENPDKGFGIIAAIIVETVATAILVWVIQGATDKLNPAGFAPIAIGFALVVLNIVAVPISGAGFNPARSLATAIYAAPGSLAMSQLWVFIVFPVIGGLIAGLTYNPLFGRKNA
jgi:aquaporin Z